MALTSKAAVLDKPFGTFSIEEVEVPAVDPNGMIVRQEMTGVCGTDVHIYHGKLFYVKYPIVLGHECVGTIDQLGQNVKEDVTGRPVKEGDRVYIIPGIRCGKCYYCTVLLQPNLCLNGAGYGFRPYPEQPIPVQGGYAEYLWVKGNTGFLKIEGDARGVCILEPLSIGVHTAEQYHFRPGETAVVQGAGAIGLMTMMAAKESGASKVIVVGAPAARLEQAKKFGADVVINIEDHPDAQERIELVKKETTGGHGADVVFEATGVPAAVPEGIDMARRGGTYIVAGHFTDSGPTSLNPFTHLNRKAITLKGVWSSEKTHFIRSRWIAESGKYPLGELISHELPLSRVGDAMEALSGKYNLDGVGVNKIAITAWK